MKISNNKIFRFQYSQNVKNELTYGAVFHVLAENMENAKILADIYVESLKLKNPFLKECYLTSDCVIVDGENENE